VNGAENAPALGGQMFETALTLAPLVDARSFSRNFPCVFSGLFCDGNDQCLFTCQIVWFVLFPLMIGRALSMGFSLGRPWLRSVRQEMASVLKISKVGRL